MLKEGDKPFRIVPVYGHANFMAKIKRTEGALQQLRESYRKNHHMKEDFGGGAEFGPYDIISTRSTHRCWVDISTLKCT